MIKNIDQNGTYWTLFDNARKPTNPVNHTLNPNQVNVEQTSGGNGQIDFYQMDSNVEIPMVVLMELLLTYLLPSQNHHSRLRMLNN